MAHAIIAAAGSGERLRAGGPKALVEVAGKAMLAWSLRAFAAAESIDTVVVAAPPGHEEEVRALAEAEPTRVVTGGETRSASVAHGLAALAEVGDPPDGLVAIHDAARPLVTPELIDHTVATLGQDAGAAGVIFLNVFAGAYMVGRALFLKDTGRKLAHVEKQLRAGDAVSRDLAERLRNED